MHTQLWINGQFAPSAGGQMIAVHDPATEEVIAQVPAGTAADVGQAVDAASAAFIQWRQMPAGTRAELLHEVARKLTERTDELATLLTREGGKPLVENRDEIGWSGACFRYYAELGRSSRGRVIPSVESSQLNLVLKEPYGVVGAIVPWNYPLLLLAWKVAPALAAGNHQAV
jgi:betaine-aldehyde dehydrogenase